MRTPLCLALSLVIVLSAAPPSVVRAQQPGFPAGEKLPPADALAWALGTNLGLAAAVHEQGSAPKIVEDRMTTCEALAGALGTTVPELPERTPGDDAKFSAEVLHYMIHDVKSIGDHLRDNHSPRHAQLFELGIKSSVLAIMYGPGDKTGLTVAQLIEDRGKECKLPAETWRPLVDSIRQKKPYDDVKKELFAMHAAVRKHLLAAN